MGKGSKRRLCRTLREENDLRWALKEGRITRAQFDRRFAKLEREGKIKRF